MRRVRTYQKYSLRDIAAMALRGAGESLIVVSVLLVISILTASWFLSGTIPYLVRMGIQLIHPDFFILCAFLLCSAMSVVIGTSFGTANTMGVVLMVIAQGSGVNPALTTGAIICGIFVGDRCSPMSSSLLLVSSVTDTKLYDNVKMCFRTMAVPFVITCGLYVLFSLGNPLQESSGTMVTTIESCFHMSPWLLLPIAVIFLLCLKKVPIKITMSCSIVTALILAFVIQGVTVEKVISSLIWGFCPDSAEETAQILSGGGIVKMLSTCGIVMGSCMVTRILEETGVIRWFSRMKACEHSLACYLKTIGAGCVTGGISCNQTAAIIMTAALRKNAYEKWGSQRFAEDITVAGTMVPALVPWCIAVYTPVHSIGFQGIGYWPYLFLFFVLIGSRLVVHFLESVHSKKEKNMAVQ